MCCAKGGSGEGTVSGRPNGAFRGDTPRGGTGYVVGDTCAVTGAVAVPPGRPLYRGVTKRLAWSAVR
jgi:hypothetical protein